MAASSLSLPTPFTVRSKCRDFSISKRGEVSVPSFDFSGLRSKSFPDKKKSNLTDGFFKSVNSHSNRAGRISAIGGHSKFVMMPVGTPRVPFRTPGEGTWQWVDLWNVLYRKRVIFVAQSIDEEFSNQILSTMLYLDSIDATKPIYLFLTCPGGEISPTLTIYDTMQFLRSQVGTVTQGYAFDMGCFLAAAGDKGLRVAYPLAFFAVQSPAGAARGQADDIQNEAAELTRVRNYFCEQLALKTGHPVEKVVQDLQRLKRFDAQQALEYGIIDRIARPRRVKPDKVNKLPSSMRRKFRSG